MSNLQSAANELLDLEIFLAPHLQRLDELKDIFREATKDGGNVGFEITVKGKGSVTTKAGTTSSFKGVQIVVGEKVGEITNDLRDELIQTGILKLENQYTTNRKPSVSVEIFASKARKRAA